MITKPCPGVGQLVKHFLRLSDLSHQRKMFSCLAQAAYLKWRKIAGDIIESLWLRRIVLIPIFPSVQVISAANTKRSVTPDIPQEYT